MKRILTTIVEVYYLIKFKNTLIDAISETEIRILNDAISIGVVRQYNVELLNKYQYKCKSINNTLLFTW
mgnify:CR=1 FL=1|jgi:hypothetical protein|tara:strand:- start:8246 stop:8452 length:207 start_codon:yes stop_codon:yes gene_type:complete